MHSENLCAKFELFTNKSLADDLEELFTDEISDDILFTKYNAWEEIPVSALRFKSNNSQICYVALVKERAITAINEQAIPAKTIAYEYMDEVPKKQNEEILAVEIDTTNMLDLTHKSDYIRYMKAIIDNDNNFYKDIPIVRRIVMNDIYYKIVYRIMNNNNVKKVKK